jgi:hypothetical protein
MDSMSTEGQRMMDEDAILFKIENPERFPAYIYSGYPDTDPYNTEVKRGGPYFEMLQHVGFRVTRLTPGVEASITLALPWTFLFIPVPATDSVAALEDLTRNRCTVILDCHFPIMQLEKVMVPNDEVMFSVIENRDVMLANLATACAVTVPQKEWAADLAEVNPRVWYLPDLDDEDETSLTNFATRFMEIAVATQQLCKAEE